MVEIELVIGGQILVEVSELGQSEGLDGFGRVGLPNMAVLRGFPLELF